MLLRMRERDEVLTGYFRLVYNSSYNSVSTVLGMGVVRMRMTRHIIDDLIRPIMLEIKATAKAAGVELPEDIVDFQIRLDPADEDFLPSMGQDAQKVCEHSWFISFTDGLTSPTIARETTSSWSRSSANH